ncbi:hypothetical protein [Gracilibacillus salinarum]|uniref:Uncharacterized protein n=1 Tax=Gracilibacillus salinarum TaxID=2932255 RepID=A0ABY4GGV4_9BACI|nr:hypothetical protein [Gracilibacillus salinarum]UOQ83561.1 hypothetical protein MUN87_12420 [Gracilibacillus salinarum]
MKSIILFVLLAVLTFLSIKYIDFDAAYFQGMMFVLASCIYTFLLFRTGFSGPKLVVGSLVLLVVLILIAFTTEIEIGIVGLIIFLLFFSEGMRARSRKNTA